MTKIKDYQAVIMGITMVVSASFAIYKFGTYNTEIKGDISSVKDNSLARSSKTNDLLSSLTVKTERDNTSINRQLANLTTKVDLIESTYITKKHFYHNTDMAWTAIDRMRFMDLFLLFSVSLLAGFLISKRVKQ